MADYIETFDDIRIRSDLDEVVKEITMLNDIPHRISVGSWSENSDTHIISEAADSNWRRTQVNVSSGDTVVISVQAYKYANPLVYIWLCNDSGLVMDTVSILETTAYKTVHTVTVTIPDGVTRLYVRQYGDGGAHTPRIEKYMRIESQLDHFFNIPRCLFYGRRTYNPSDGSYSVDVHRASTEPLSFDDDIIVSSEACGFMVYYVDSNNSYTAITDRAFVPYGSRVVISAIDEELDITGDKIDSIMVSSTMSGYEAFRNDYYCRIDETVRVSALDALFNGALYTTNDIIGARLTGSAYDNHRSTSRVLYSPYDLTIYLTRLSTCSMRVFVDDVPSYVINQEHSVTIPAGTEFTIHLWNNNDPQFLGANCMLCTPLARQGYTHYTLPLSTSLSLPRVDAAFMDENGTVYMIDRLNDMYYAVVDNEIVAQGEFDGPIDHANSCNYANGKLYVSAWMPTVKEIIRVFDVDVDSKTITYSNSDITIPLDDKYGACEYYVQPGETEILALAMSTDYDSMIFSKWTKSGDTYIESNVTYLPIVENQAEWIQGMTYHDGKVYYICGEPDNSRHIGIVVFDLETRLSEFLPAMSNTSTYEIEAIFPVGENVFLDVDARGRMILQYIASNETR